MDPLSVIGAVASLVALATKVGVHCYHFYDTYRDTEHELAPTRWNIDILTATLEDIHKQSLDLHAENRLAKKSTTRMHYMNIRGNDLFNGMLSLMRKYKCMTGKFRKKLLWMAHGNPKVKELGGYIANYKDAVSLVLTVLIKDADDAINKTTAMNQTTYHTNSQITIGFPAVLSEDSMLRGTVNALSDAIRTSQTAVMRPVANSQQQLPSSTSANAGSRSTASAGPSQDAEESHSHAHSASREFESSEAAPRRSDTGQSSTSIGDSDFYDTTDDFIHELKMRNTAAFSQQQITIGNPFTAPGSPALGSSDPDNNIHQPTSVNTFQAADFPSLVSSDSDSIHSPSTSSSVHEDDGALSNLRTMALYGRPWESGNPLDILTELSEGPYTFSSHRPIHEPPVPNLRDLTASQPDFRRFPTLSLSESVEEWDLATELEMIGIYGDMNLASSQDAGVVDATRNRFHEHLADELFIEGQDVICELEEARERRLRMRKKAATW